MRALRYRGIDTFLAADEYAVPCLSFSTKEGIVRALMYAVEYDYEKKGLIVPKALRSLCIDAVHAIPDEQALYYRRPKCYYVFQGGL